MNKTQSLLQWYDKCRRALPWREDPPVPYHVWVSEIMLQQTRVEAVRGYYTRFLEALPDVESLARVPERKLLKLWEGLGYYNRARNLKKAAGVVVRDFGGEMPHDVETLRSLPGIGEYTAAAIASIAYGVPAIALDGNLLRVFARLTLYEDNAKAPAAFAAARSFYDTLLAALPDGRSAGDVNQALMDLGATVCLPNAQPLCRACPFVRSCKAHRAKKEMDVPVLPAKKPRMAEDMTVLLLRRGDAIAVRKRKSGGLLGGMYEFPHVPGHLSMEEVAGAVEEMGLVPLRVKALPDAKHLFTHREWHMTGYEVRCADDGSAPQGMRFVRRKMLDDTVALPSAFVFYKSYV